MTRSDDAQDDLNLLLARAKDDAAFLTRLIDAAVVARKLDVSPRSVRRWCVNGRIRYRQSAGGHYRVPLSELVRLMQITGHNGHI